MGPTPIRRRDDLLEQICAIFGSRGRLGLELVLHIERELAGPGLGRRRPARQSVLGPGSLSSRRTARARMFAASTEVCVMRIRRSVCSRASAIVAGTLLTASIAAPAAAQELVAGGL